MLQGWQAAELLHDRIDLIRKRQVVRLNDQARQLALIRQQSEQHVWLWLILTELQSSGQGSVC